MSIEADRSGLVAELFAIVVAEALVDVELCLQEWVAVLNANNGNFSLLRAMFGENARMQLADLSRSVYADESHDSLELAQRISALPTLQKVAILDIVDRFWSSRESDDDSLQDLLESLGVVFSGTRACDAPTRRPDAVLIVQSCSTTAAGRYGSRTSLG